MRWIINTLANIKITINIFAILIYILIQGIFCTISIILKQNFHPYVLYLLIFVDLLSFLFVAFINNKLSQKHKKLEFEHQAYIDQLFLTLTKNKHKADFLRSFLDASPDLIYIYSSIGEIIGCNAAFENVSGYTEKELIKFSNTKLKKFEFSKLFVNTNSLLTEDKEQLLFTKDIDIKGQKLFFEIRTVICYEDKSYYLIGFARDITDRMSYIAEMEKNSQQKISLISKISHELKTPLNGIIGLSRILIDLNLSQQQQQYVQTIYTNAVFLSNLFKDMNDITAYEQNSIVLHKENFDLLSLMNDITNVAHILTSNKKIEFLLELAPDLPKFLNTDKTRLYQILLNLLANAVKFTDKGFVQLQVTNIDNKQINFTIIDTGCGISEADQQNIFSQYFQAENSNKQHLGNGIGLYLAKILTTKLNGNISCYSKLGVGSTFLLSIPIQNSTILPSQSTANIEKIEKSDKLQLHILLVEDIEVNVLVAKLTLEKMAHTVTVAYNAEQFFNFMSSSETYDLILLDINLPDMTGFDIARLVNEKYTSGEYYYLPPIIALTANVVADNTKYLDSGFEYVLEKPLSINELLKCIQQIFLNKNVDDEFQNKIINNSTTNTNQSIDLSCLSNNIYDKKYINDLLIYIDKTNYINNLDLLQSQMYEYMIQLIKTFQAVNYPDFIETAHKIKGAFAAVGLSRISGIANTLQNIIDFSNTNLEEINKLIEEIEHNWVADINKLKDIVMYIK